MHVPHRFRFLLLCRAFVVHVRQTQPNSPALAKRMLVKFPALIHSNSPGTPSAPNTRDTTHRTSNPNSLNSPEAPSTNLPELPNSPDLAFERSNAFIRVRSSVHPPCLNIKTSHRNTHDSYPLL
ncbi:hypothetical protein DEU56DRAFT_271987 [Suillus clintonianus]|uniref:uncharacterized protein n=1 Tax=Suillus clintonianus TaxID=1904413 RepID=UPI001B87107D|nr:uncharacterized protein DEU56DRAFT_271987 [Suillus clintonianus]KAG2141955.1 hypothetical protein DEU56DRAFT_271987 [Suillus clintonianus]